MVHVRSSGYSRGIQRAEHATDVRTGADPRVWYHHVSRVNVGAVGLADNVRDGNDWLTGIGSRGILRWFRSLLVHRERFYLSWVRVSCPVQSAGSNLS